MLLEVRQSDISARKCLIIPSFYNFPGPKLIEEHSPGKNIYSAGFTGQWIIAYEYQPFNIIFSRKA